MSGRESADDIDPDLFLAATVEVDGQTPDPALWAKSMALSDGDEEKARHRYVRARAVQWADAQRTQETAEPSPRRLPPEPQSGRGDEPEPTSQPRSDGGPLDGLLPTRSTSAGMSLVSSEPLRVISWFLTSFRGRVSRRWWWLWTTAVSAVALCMPSEEALFGLALVVAYFNFAVMAKRWHDQGYSGWCSLFAMIPWVGWLVAVFWLGFRRGDVGQNKYGRDPLGMASSAPAAPAADTTGPPR